MMQLCDRLVKHGVDLDGVALCPLRLNPLLCSARLCAVVLACALSRRGLPPLLLLCPHRFCSAVLCRAALFLLSALACWRPREGGQDANPRDGTAQHKRCGHSLARRRSSHRPSLLRTQTPSLPAPMSKRSKFAAAAQTNVALGSTGSARRDKATHAAFARLCARIPLLAVNAPAKAQLTSIVFDGLAQVRAQEDRNAELCEAALSTAGCSLCSWEQKAFCESCGTDFRRTPSKAGYPLFLPVFDSGRLHIDLALACSERCVTTLMEQKEKLLAEKETAKQNAAASSSNKKNGNTAASTSSSSSVRVQSSAKDPHQTIWSLLFHSFAYGLTLYTLFACDLTLSALLSECAGWSLMLSLAVWGLWLLNLMFTFTSGGAFSSVARLRQALSAAVSVAAVMSAVSFLAWVAGFGTQNAQDWSDASGGDGIMRPASAAHRGLAAASAAVAASAASSAASGVWGQLVQQLKHTMPLLLLIVEVMSWPHEKMVSALVPRRSLASSARALRARVSRKLIPVLALRLVCDSQNPWLERVLCLLPPSFFLLFAYHTELLMLSHTELGFVAFVLPLLGCLVVGALTRAFQALRDWRWSAYVVPKHLMINPA